MKFLCKIKNNKYDYFEYELEEVCSQIVSFGIDNNGYIHDVNFIGGCNGNLKAISKLVENKNAVEIIKILSGIFCGNKKTSCADQFAIAIEDSLIKNNLKILDK